MRKAHSLLSPDFWPESSLKLYRRAARCLSEANRHEKTSLSFILVVSGMLLHSIGSGPESLSGMAAKVLD